MKPIARKDLTVDVIERRRISFRLGQEVLDRDRHLLGVIVALTSAGCFLRRERDGNFWDVDRWFVKYNLVRPCDGRRYLEVTN